jgi:hypothetical protein
LPRRRRRCGRDRGPARLGPGGRGLGSAAESRELALPPPARVRGGLRCERRSAEGNLLQLDGAGIPTRGIAALLAGVARHSGHLPVRGTPADASLWRGILLSEQEPNILTPYVINISVRKGRAAPNGICE